jgi:hypothetical protein
MKFLAIVFIAFVLAGCGSIQLESKRDALLMPEPIAKRILIKYFGEEWVKDPRGRYSQGFGNLCGNGGWGSLPFQDINVVRVFQNGQVILLTKTNWWTVGIPCTQMIYEVKGNFNKEDVKDIVDALASLGAMIDEQ